MKIETKIIDFPKKYVFSVKKGRTNSIKNVCVKIIKDTMEGYGEIALGTNSEYQPEALADRVNVFFKLKNLKNLSISEIWQVAKEQDLPPPAQAAIDMALWDLYGKSCRRPCYQLYGVTQQKIFSSVTIGANNKDVMHKQIVELLNTTQAKYLKIKLGYPEGIEKDKEVFLIAYEAALPFGITLRVDANGGWSTASAMEMLQWLKKFNIQYVEQPLGEDEIEAQRELKKNNFMPIFLDESCHSSQDISLISGCCDGIVIKLMKCGGITDALRMINAARAHGLKIALGCKSESTIGILAALSIASLFDFIDLDSYLYILNDPLEGKICFSKGAIAITKETEQAGFF